MQNELGFQGEIEFAEGLLPDAHFGEFESLSNISLIHELAAEFTNSMELMPYQKAGDVKRLLVSVYIRLKSKPGNVIAVLTRDPYPNSWEELEVIIKTSENRMQILEKLTDVYQRESIDQARAALEKLELKVHQQKEAGGGW